VIRGQLPGVLQQADLPDTLGTDSLPSIPPQTPPYRAGFD
jgi:hypothetical protein